PAVVNFHTIERCIPTDTFACDPDGLQESHASYWPDTPYDRLCSSSSNSCADRTSPTFFTEKRVDRITTSVLIGSDYDPVNTWDLTQSFPHTGDSTDRTLWLESIKQEG